MGRTDQRTAVGFDKDVTQEMGGTVMKMWIARDANNKIYLHKGKPTRTARTGLWESYDGIIKLGTDEYPEVTFENSPVEVEIVIKK